MRVSIVAVISCLVLQLFVVVSCKKHTAQSVVGDCIDKNCADYTSRYDAQADYDANPACRNDLDHDGDGIACEEPGNGVSGTYSTPSNNNTSSGCPTTSNCGCSGKSKANCASSCCQWIVGTGCVCQ